MKKVGIVTLFGLYNFGNRLQNYAVQEIIKSYGFDVQTIISSEIQPKSYLKFWLKSIKNGTLVRSLKFRRFNRKYISTYIVHGYPELFPEEISNEFKYFVVGSDQVWNPDIRQTQRENFFLSFAHKQQRIAISPSIAVSSIPDKWRDSFINGLDGFTHISVRENNSVELISELTGQQAIVLADPTMIIPKERWQSIERQVKKLSSHYLLSLFLGKVDEKRKEEIATLASDNKLEIIDLNSKKWIGIGPDEFLYLVHHADIVCTDSFHCLVFSILYNRSFVAFDRCIVSDKDINGRTGSRIDTLLQKFSSNTYVQNEEQELIVNKFSEETVKNVLGKERKKYSEFLKSQLV